jgi:hypothetical protein
MGQVLHGSATTTDPWPPFSGRCLLVDADDCAVDHEIYVVPVGRERVESPLPHTGMTPSAETAVNRLPPTIAFRQIAPVRA